jgi:integrase
MTLGVSMVGHMRWGLNGIFKLAESDGLINRNPAAQLRIPKNCKPGRSVRPLSEEEVNEYLGVLDLQERLMARLAIFEGLRGPGEILALRWGAFEQEFVWVRERVYQGKFDVPKNGKVRDAALSDGTKEDLEELRSLARSTAADAFVFPSENPVSPLDMGTFGTGHSARVLRKSAWNGQRFRFSERLTPHSRISTRWMRRSRPISGDMGWG